MEVEFLVELFLDTFKVKLGIWGLLIRHDRQKNAQTMADLEIRKADVEAILAKLTAQDYSKGPLPDKLHGGSEMWVFGKQIKGHEVYIKITLGTPDNPTICISFHFSEHPMGYPLKKPPPKLE